MKTVLFIISIIGLILTLVPAFLVFVGKTDLDTAKGLMIAGTVLWFATAPFWMKTSTNPAS